MIEVIVGAIRLEAQDIHSFELFRADGAALPSFEPGAHIDLHLPNGLVRQYSLCGPAERPRHYRIAVLRCRDSRGGSATLHAELRVGQRLRIGEPRNLFPLSPEPGPRLLFAGGIGITPLLAMAERLARDGADFQLHYCAHSAERAAFVDYLGRCAFADRVHCHFDHGESSRRADLRALLATSPRDVQLYLAGRRASCSGSKKAPANWAGKQAACIASTSPPRHETPVRTAPSKCSWRATGR